jgi:hypothetical protein
MFYEIQIIVILYGWQFVFMRLAIKITKEIGFLQSYIAAKSKIFKIFHHTRSFSYLRQATQLLFCLVLQKIL